MSDEEILVRLQALNLEMAGSKEWRGIMLSTADAPAFEYRRREFSMEQLLTAEMLLREIYQAETELRWFEQKYGLLSETFYRLYEQGQLRDENPAEIREYLEWSGWWEIYQSRRQRYEQAIAQRLQAITAPASLVDLHVSQLSISG